MKLTLPVKLAPTPEQHQALLETMERFNEACNDIAEVAYQNRTANKIRLQKILYYRIREQYGLSAQMTVRAVGKVVEAYKRDKNIKPTFKPHGAMIYDERILSWKGLEYASILTLQGRILVSMRLGEYQKARMDRIRGQADLILREGIFYLFATIDVPEETPYDPIGTLGVDLGLKYLAYDSDGEGYSGAGVDEVRERSAELKASLQSCGSKSAKRHLRKLSGKVNRFNADTNHVVSKRLVAKAKDTQRRIALEDLGGIREGVTVRKSQRSRLHSWGFYQLRQFIEYKAKLEGVQVIPVYPRGTSHICPACGVEDRRNRPERDLFRCIGCGYAGQADHVAAINIAARADVNRPIVSEDFFEHTTHLQGQAHDLSRG